MRRKMKSLDSVVLRIQLQLLMRSRRRLFMVSPQTPRPERQHFHSKSELTRKNRRQYTPTLKANSGNFAARFLKPPCTGFPVLT
jgi:hypothetical protein